MEFFLLQRDVQNLNKTNEEYKLSKEIGQLQNEVDEAKWKVRSFRGDEEGKEFFLLQQEVRNLAQSKEEYKLSKKIDLLMNELDEAKRKVRSFRGDEEGMEFFLLQQDVQNLTRAFSLEVCFLLFFFNPLRTGIKTDFFDFALKSHN